MISLITDPQLPLKYFADEFLMTKIRANLLSYGTECGFLDLWYQWLENSVAAIICKFEQSVIIVAEKNADFDEIKEFLEVIGFENIQAEPFILEILGFEFTEYQVVFRESEKGRILPEMPNIKAVYDLLYGEENPHITKSDFEGFYVDLSHRIRHNTATAVLGESAVCVASHLTDTAAVISGVVTKKANRKSGLGSLVLKGLVESLNGRKVFAAAESLVVPFYIKNGFKKCGKTAIYNIEE